MSMTATLPLASTLTFAAESLLCLLIGGLFATLLSAYTLAGQAGIKRLGEKFPRSAARLARWEARWDELRYALLLCVVTLQVAIVYFALRAVWLRPGTPATRTGIGILTVLAITLVFHVLPRALSRNYADKIATVSLPLTALFGRLLYPAAWPLAWLALRLHDLFQEGSAEEHRPTAEDEIRSAVGRASTEDLEEEERRIIERAVELGETVAREIMTPRVDVESLEDTETVESAVQIVKGSSHSRFPVYHDSIDDIRGITHVKDLLRLLGEGRAGQPILRAAKETPFVPETMPVNDLLTLLRSEKTQTAVVVDEYGGTAGLVTMEDVVEELVGEILDEYDEDELPIHRLSDGSAVLDARMPVDEVNRRLQIAIPEEEDYDSVGGYVFHALGRIPRPGEQLEGPGFTVTIQTASARQLQTLRILKAPA